jgi:aryl-alcohol dehydrogenase-like predicted oxidoreductase
VGAGRGGDASWNVAASTADLRRAVEDNLRNLRLDTLEVVNLRAMLGSGSQGPEGGLSAAPLEALAALQKE